MRRANLFRFQTPAGLFGLVLYSQDNVSTVNWQNTPEDSKALMRAVYPDVFLVSAPITWEQFLYSGMKKNPALFFERCQP